MSENLDRQQWLKLETLFEELCTQSPEQQKQSIEKLKETEPELAGELSLLLKQDGILSGQTTSQGTGLVRANYQLGTGDTFDGYRLLFPVEGGGQSEVWCATHSDPESIEPQTRQFAIKFIDPQASGGNSSRRVARFRREVDLLSRLDHPNIAPLVDSGESEKGYLYLVTPWISGHDIRTHCDRNHLPVDARVRLLQRVLDAVALAHRFNIVHRDIKPQNILVDQTGHPVLLDFGIAKLLSAEDTDADLMLSLTRTQERPMTLAYASPEQIKAEPISTSTDVYQCGLLAYELLTGHHPYSSPAQPGSSNLYDGIVSESCRLPSAVVQQDAVPLVVEADSPPTINAHLNAGLRSTSPADLSSTLLGDLDTSIMRSLEKLPEKRFATVAEFSQDLKDWLSSERNSASNRIVSLQQYVRKLPLTAVSLGMLVTALIALVPVAWGLNGWSLANQKSLVASECAQQQMKRTNDLIGLVPGGNREAAEIACLVALGNKSQADTRIKELDVSKSDLSIEDRITLATSCLAVGRVSKGLSLFSEIRRSGVDALGDFSPAVEYEIRYLLARLLLEGGWAYGASQWIEIPSAELADELGFESAAKMRAVQIAAATRNGQLDFAQDNLADVLAHKTFQSLPKRDAELVLLTHADLLGQQGNWEQCLELLNLDASLAEGFEADNLWYARALRLAARQPELEVTEVESLLIRALDVVTSYHKTHPLVADLCLQLAETCDVQNRAIDAEKWIARALAHVDEQSEWGGHAAFDVVERQTSGDSETDETEVLDWLKKLQSYREVNEMYPYLNVSLAERHLALSLKQSEKAQTLRIARELQRWVLKTDPVDEWFLLVSMVGEKLSAGSSADESLSRKITSIYDSLTKKHSGPAGVLLSAARSGRKGAFKNEIDWLQIFKIYRDTDFDTQLDSLIHLATSYVEEHRDSAKFLATELEAFLPSGDQLPAGDRLPSTERIQWFKLIALLGDFKLIETDIRKHLDSDSISIRDECAEILTIGLVRTGRVEQAMRESKILMQRHAPDVNRLRAGIWECGQWLQSQKHPLLDQWNKNQE